MGDIDMVDVGAAGEIAKVTHTLTPDGAVVSIELAIGLHIQTTRDSNEPTRSPEPLSPETWSYR